MKKINFLYLAIIPVLCGVFYINWNYVQHTAVFYGFAENKETEINLDHPVLIKKVYVTPGQSVNRGDLLMEVEHAKFELRMNELSSDLETTAIKNKEQKQAILNDIARAENLRNNRLAVIDAQIEKLQVEIDFNKSLLKNLKSIQPPKEGSKTSTPNQVKLAALQKEKEMIERSTRLEIQQLRTELANLNEPYEVQLEKLKNEKAFYESEGEGLFITAPSDGLIGNVHCREGENISSFNTLVSFYERNPTLVKGYVHETLLLQVKVGDTLEVSSSLHPTHRGYGRVSGLGTRIVEIPTRLRKRPEIQTYGREVLIEIPAENPFLQKEKVILNFLNPEEVKGVRFFPFVKRDAAKSHNQTQEAVNLQ